VWPPHIDMWGARRWQSVKDYLAGAEAERARRPHLAQVAPATAIGTTVREEVVSELSRAIDLIDHEDQAATREARDLLIRLKALLSAPADGAVCKNQSEARQ
jgi:hypothetical protein